MLNYLREKFNMPGDVSKMPEGEVLEVELPGTVPEGKLDIYSGTWLFIKSWVEGKLYDARKQNDLLKNDEIKTAALRGRIKLLKELLVLPEAK